MNKRVVSLIVAMIILFAGCLTVTAQAADDAKIFRTISPEEAIRMLQKQEDILFLDVRTPEERSRGYIAGSKLVSFNDVAMGNLDLPKDKPILLVCAVGGRSYIAAQILSQRGYREVYNLSGGVQNWYKSGLPLVYDKQ